MLPSQIVVTLSHIHHNVTNITVIKNDTFWITVPSFLNFSLPISLLPGIKYCGTSFGHKCIVLMKSYVFNDFQKLVRREFLFTRGKNRFENRSWAGRKAGRLPALFCPSSTGMACAKSPVHMIKARLLSNWEHISVMLSISIDQSVPSSVTPISLSDLPNWGSVKTTKSKPVESSLNEKCNWNWKKWFENALKFYFRTIWECTKI